MEIVIQLRLVDSITKNVWETENHNDDDKQDDYHRDIKPAIMADLEPRLKEKFGKNCDVQIRDGKIHIVPQRVNGDTGKKDRESINTHLRAEDYFENMSRLLLEEVVQELGCVNSGYYLGSWSIC